MPHFRKLDPADILVAPTDASHMASDRAHIAATYDALLADFVIGDYGRVELLDGEQRNTVRNRLHAAARRRGLVLRFRPGRGPLIFCVEAASSADPTVDTIPALPLSASSIASARSPQLLRALPLRRREQKVAGRYDAVLPRWMRANRSDKRNKR